MLLSARLSHYGNFTKENTVRTALFFGLLSMVMFSSSVFAEPTGKELFDKTCKMCHGIDCKGNAKLAQGMKIKPELLDLTRQEVKGKKDDVLKTNVANGSGKMKGFKDKLKADEISLIVAHIRTLK